MNIEIMLKKQLTTDAEGLEPSHTIIVVEEFSDVYEFAENRGNLQFMQAFKKSIEIPIKDIICIKIK